jgi:DNA-binding NarL/FixJ family response regulator
VKFRFSCIVMSKIKVIITEDKIDFAVLVREELEFHGIEVVAIAVNGEDLLRELSTHSPDVILLDLEMPVLDGSKSLEILQQLYPSIKVIILSTHYSRVLVENFIERGAKGYIPKDELAKGILVNAIKTVCEGGKFVYEYPNGHPNFTRKQAKLMSYLFEGLTNKQIADELGITSRAVEKQRQTINQRAGVKKTIDFYKYAFSRGLQFLGLRKKKD